MSLQLSAVDPSVSSDPEQPDRQPRGITLFDNVLFIAGFACGFVLHMNSGFRRELRLFVHRRGQLVQVALGRLADGRALGAGRGPGVRDLDQAHPLRRSHSPGGMARRRGHDHAR